MPAFTPLPQMLETYQPFNDLEALHVTQLKQHLAESQNPYSRDNYLAHTVTDAWILNNERTHILLLVHGDSGLWLTPGGHTDGNPDMFDGTVREVEEETGIPRTALKQLGGLYDINVGLIPTRNTKKYGIEPPHMHFDICFAFETDMSQPLIISDESKELRWVPLTEAATLILPEHTRRLHKTLQGKLA